MTEIRVKIKDIEMSGDTAIRIIKCLKNHDPEMWKILKGELKKRIDP